MSGGVRSKKQERAQLVHGLRSAGSSWVEIAEALRVSYQINARVAFRYAHGWSQEAAAEEWNKRWPDELKSFKNFSHWESWPGHAPTYDNLSKLAELYECSISDLLADLPNFRHLDTAGSSASSDGKKRLILPNGRTLVGGTGGTTQDDREPWGALSPLLLTQDAAALVQWLDQIDVNELAQVIVVWLQRLDPSVNRRTLLSKLSLAFSLAAVSPLLDALDPDEYTPVVRFLQQPDTFELPALAYTERMIVSLRQQSDVLGPQLTLPSAIGHRQLAEQLAKVAPAAFRPRAISAYAELTQFLGWLCFEMKDYRGAQHYYDDARSAAHDAENVELATYILCTMSQLAVSQDKPRVGIDHAAAAAVWAEQCRSPFAKAFAADRAVRAYMAINQPDKCHEALDQEYAALKAASPDEPTASWWDFFNEAFYWDTAGRCALHLQQSKAALSAIDKSLTLVNPANLRQRIFRLLLQAEVRIQQEEIPEASSIVADATRLAEVNSSQQIVQRISEVRGLLTPWARTKPVRELDERLAAHRTVGHNGSAKLT